MHIPPHLNTPFLPMAVPPFSPSSPSCLHPVLPLLYPQEMQSDHYWDFFAPELAKVGYMPIYKKKTTEMYSDNKLVIDGCATFFKRDRFSLVKKYEVRRCTACMYCQVEV